MRSSCRPGKIFKITVLHCCFRQAIYVWVVLSTNWLMVTFKLRLKSGLITEKIFPPLDILGASMSHFLPLLPFPLNQTSWWMHLSVGGGRLSATGKPSTYCFSMWELLELFVLSQIFARFGSGKNQRDDCWERQGGLRDHKKEVRIW